MNNNGYFNNGPPPPGALMSYPFPMHNPALIDPSYTNQVPQHFQTHATGFYNPRPLVCLALLILIFFANKSLDSIA